MHFFLQGLTMGLAYVAPIGLQNLFVINTALTQTRSRALRTALIVIFFDITLALACFFGIGAIVERYVWLQKGILVVGSLIVIYIGIGLLRAKPTDDTEQNPDSSLKHTVATAGIVTWLNPQALIDGTVMLGAFYVTLPMNQSVSFISGVASASCLWFIGISFFISLFRHKFDAKIMRGINLICGIIMIGYGLKLLFAFIETVSA